LYEAGGPQRPADLLLRVRKLIGYSYTDKSPTVTHPYVAGGGEAAARVFGSGLVEADIHRLSREASTYEVMHQRHGALLGRILSE
jgi:hypothetical protein